MLSFSWVFLLAFFFEFLSCDYLVAVFDIWLFFFLFTRDCIFVFRILLGRITLVSGFLVSVRCFGSSILLFLYFFNMSSCLKFEN